MKTASTIPVLFLCCTSLPAQYAGEGPAKVYPDTTQPFDPAAYVYNWDSIMQSRDSVVAIQDSLAESASASDGDSVFTWSSDTTYILFVLEPNPCVDWSAVHWGSSPPAVTFIDYGPDYFSPCDYYWSPWESPGWMVYPPTDKHEPWNAINLFDTSRPHFSRIGFAATRPLEVSTVPPAKNPEPEKPDALPSQFWYEAILPQTTRLKLR